MAHSSAPNFRTGRARNEVNREENDQDYDSSRSAASVAVNLLSAARLMLKLDSVFTEYSAQYLVNNACSKKEDGQGEIDLKLTVKYCLEFALKEGIPKAEAWPHLGCLFKPPSSYKPALISMKGDVIETKKLEEACMLLKHQPVGAKLHVFSPAIDLVGDGIYFGLSRDSDSDYVGLRDVIIFNVTKVGQQTVAEVKIWYKKKVAYIKVALDFMFMSIPKDGSTEINEAASKPGRLLVDFCVPRLSIE